MRWLSTLVFAIVACASSEVLLPGRTVYHAGWFNVLLIALAVLLGYALRSAIRATDGRVRMGIVAVAAGAFAMAFATVASGLLAPDNHSIVAAPGSSVQLSDLGATLLFPVDPTQAVQIRHGVRLASIRTWRYVGTGILRIVPRSVVGVEARDARGGTLTITQPNGTAFLSPVLLMESRQTIAGMSLPYDSFAVPAIHRIVHVVAFSARQAAQLRGGTGVPAPEVLFAVDDESDRPLPHGLGMARADETVTVDRLTLRASIFDYPSIEVMAAPSLAVMGFAALTIIVGLVFIARRD